MAESFKDMVGVTDGDGPVTVTINGNRGAVYAGGGGQVGSVRLRDQAGAERVSVGADGLISIRSEAAGEVVTIDARQATMTVGAEGQGGSLKVLNAEGGLLFHVTASFAHLRGALVVGASNATGEFAIMAPNGKPAIHASGLTAKLQLGNDGNAGDFALLDNEATPVVEANGLTATVTIGGTGKPGHAVLRNRAGEEVGRLSAAPAGLFLGRTGSPGEITILNAKGQSTFGVDGGNGIVAVGLGDNRVVIDGSAGDIRLGGADCAELFSTAGGGAVDPGTVMVLAEPGTLDVACEPYDRRVAGVVSGAGGLRPGIVLNRREDEPGSLPIALNGRVFCKVDATFAPVVIGDLLTTSPTPGHAMKATDPARRHGAVLGKAMGPLDAGTGLIPVLVSLA
jgi:hypothetical protein